MIVVEVYVYEVSQSVLILAPGAPSALYFCHSISPLLSPHAITFAANTNAMVSSFDEELQLHLILLRASSTLFECEAAEALEPDRYWSCRCFARGCDFCWLRLARERLKVAVNEYMLLALDSLPCHLSN
jgi:hypothetical protein